MIDERAAVPATGQNITVDLAPGLHDVKLTVTDSAGRTRVVRKAIRVVSLPSPVASFAWSPRDTLAGATITFNGSSSLDVKTPTANSPINQYRWDFGDSTPVVTTVGPTAQAHTFAAGGSYDVKLTVTSASGLTSSTTRKLWVGTQPLFSGSVATQRINDTGITFSGEYPSGNNTGCTGSNNLAAQDCSNGRDANLPAKVGGGGAGFDFTKISNSGGVLPASAALGGGPDDWACTRDNVTGLTWEVKTTSGLRSQSHLYSWYSMDSNNNGGSVGTASGGTCQTTGRCDTEKFVQDVNAAALCAMTDWRMPTRKEFEGIVDFGRISVSIDSAFFPNTTVARRFWSGSPVASASGFAWSMYFDGGYSTSNEGRWYGGYVRLVRAGR